MPVRLNKVNRVATLTIDSPEVKNALTPSMGREVSALCDEIDADTDIGAAVIAGARGTFCSGADRRTWDPSADQASDTVYKDFSAVYQCFRRVGALTVPTVAAVRGAAVGAGLNLMLATDLRIVAHDARILAGFLRIGLHPGGGFFTLLSRVAGREATAALGLFGESIDGTTAQRIGLAWESLPDDEVEPRALELAQGAARDPELSREAIRSLRTELGPPGMSWDAALHFERATQMWSQRRRTEA